MSPGPARAGAAAVRRTRAGKQAGRPGRNPGARARWAGFARSGTGGRCPKKDGNAPLGAMPGAAPARAGPPRKMPPGPGSRSEDGPGHAAPARVARAFHLALRGSGAGEEEKNRRSRARPRERGAGNAARGRAFFPRAPGCSHVRAALALAAQIFPRALGCSASFLWVVGLETLAERRSLDIYARIVASRLNSRAFRLRFGLFPRDNDWLRDTGDSVARRDLPRAG